MAEDHQHAALEFTPPSIDHLNEVLPAYHFESLLATGGMGAVYKASQSSLERPVAIKVLPAELSADATFRESFASEAKLMGRLNHPNLISVYDFGEIEGMLFIVMEFVDGVTLYEKTYGAHLEQNDAIDLTLSIAGALDHAHSAGILHRDIKPANIFITNKGEPKIGDFGLARLANNTESGVIYGTPGYTAPEVVPHPELVGPATDVYSVGIILYELLTGEIPGEIYQPVSNFDDCDPILDQIISKAISPDLNQRYASIYELATALEDARETILSASTDSNTATAVAATPTLLASPATSATTAVSMATPATAAARPSVTAMRPVPPQKSKTGRNLFVIVALLVGIYFAFQWKTRRENEIAEIAAKNEAIDAMAAEKLRGKSGSGTTSITTPKPPKVDRQVNAKKTLIQIMKLKKQLAAGDRPINQLPKDGVILGDNERYVVFIDKKLSWQQADRWSRAYGGYLATIRNQEEADEICAIIPPSKRAWFGAATSGNKQWTWVDGTPWADYPKLRLTGHLAYGQTNRAQLTTVKRDGHTSGFLVEWRLDGSDPASIKARMQRAAAAMGSAKAAYPASSFDKGKRHYYLCPIPLTLSEARKLASIGGAHIAAPSSEIEQKSMNLFLPKHTEAGSTCRIGGVLRGKKWIWLSGEDWENPNWGPGSPTSGNSVAIVNTTGSTWKDVSATEATDYTLFEWSNDKKRTTGIANSAGSDHPEINKLQKKAAELITTAIAKRNEKSAKLIKSLKDDVEKHYNSLGDTVKAAQEESTQELLSFLESDTRIEEYVSGMGPSASIKQKTREAYKDQQAITANYEREIDKLRTFYVAKLNKISVKLKRTKQHTALKEAEAEIAQAGRSLESFVELFQ